MNCLHLIAWCTVNNVFESSLVNLLLTFCTWLGISKIDAHHIVRVFLFAISLLFLLLLRQERTPRHPNHHQSVFMCLIIQSLSLQSQNGSVFCVNCMKWTRITRTSITLEDNRNAFVVNDSTRMTKCDICTRRSEVHLVPKSSVKNPLIKYNTILNHRCLRSYLFHKTV